MKNITSQEVLRAHFIIGALEAATANNDFPENIRIFTKDLLALTVSYFPVLNAAELKVNSYNIN